MTLRYRCPWCGAFGRHLPKEVRKHILKAHRAILVGELGIIETFTTRKTPDPPRNAAKGRPPLNPGVSGEGDS